MSSAKVKHKIEYKRSVDGEVKTELCKSRVHLLSCIAECKRHGFIVVNIYDVSNKQ